MRRSLIVAARVVAVRAAAEVHAEVRAVADVAAVAVVVEDDHRA